MMLSALILALTSGAGSAPPERLDSVFRQYDLAAHGGQVIQYYQGDLFPGSLHLDFDTAAEAGDSHFDTDDIEEILREFLEEELQYEGRHYHVNNHGQLLLLAPESVHDQTRKILTAISLASGIQGQLQVDILNTPAGQTPLPTGVISLADLEKAKAVYSEHITESYTLPLRVNVPSVIQATKSHELLADYDVEVASNAMSYDPLVINMRSGTRLQVKASPNHHGLDLAMMYWNGTTLGAVREHQFNVKGRVHTESNFDWSNGPDSIQSLSIAQRSMALNTSIPKDSALVLGLHSNAGSAQQRIILRLKGSMLPPVQSSDLGDGKSLQLVRTSVFSPARLTPEVGERFAALLVSGELLRNRISRGAEWELRAHFVEEDSNGYLEMLRNAVADSSWNGSVDWFSLCDANPTQPGNGKAVRALVDAVQIPSDLVRVQARLVRGAGGGEEVLGCDLPLRVGTESAIVLGVESTTVSEFDSQIATGSAVHDPQVTLDLDGAVLLLHPTRTSDGRYHLRVRCHAQIESGSEHMLSSDRSFDRLELKQYDTLRIDQWIDIKASGKSRLTLGNDSDGRGANALALEVTFSPATGGQHFNFNITVE